VYATVGLAWLWLASFVFAKLLLRWKNSKLKANVAKYLSKPASVPAWLKKGLDTRRIAVIYNPISGSRASEFVALNVVQPMLAHCRSQYLKAGGTPKFETTRWIDVFETSHAGHAQELGCNSIFPERYCICIVIGGGEFRSLSPGFVLCIAWRIPPRGLRVACASHRSC
jgi:hypothetical protein